MTKYMLRLQPGGKISVLERHAREIALSMKSYNVPIIKPIIEEGLISLEFIIRPISNIDFFDMAPYLKSSPNNVPVVLGRAYTGGNLIPDLTQMPHLLIAGTTGSGKSTMLHSIICSTFFRNNINLVLVDPKVVEFSYYNHLKNLLYPVINMPNDAYDILDELINEMNNRFWLFKKVSANNIVEYNKKKRVLPYIVLVIDEFSGLMSQNKKRFQAKMSDLAQRSRSAGIHIILATQRPDVGTITGAIKANFPARISCAVPSKTDSRVILDRNGADLLLGCGDALISSGKYDMLRFKGAWINPEAIQKLVEANKKSWWERIWK
jgi:S-DNA-T family DNA segregation ATPase FtsK/SpoIIIE